MSDERRDPDELNVKPSEQRGGSTPGDAEAKRKGPWAAKAAEGVVPAELGGSDAPEEMLAALTSFLAAYREGAPAPAASAVR
jgi:hypothetical protein